MARILVAQALEEISEPLHAVVLHYGHVAPLLVHAFAGRPLVYASYPQGFDHAALFHGEARNALPASIPTVAVESKHGEVRYVAIAVNSLLWLVHRYYAVEFHSWSPTPTDPVHMRFARVLLEPTGKADETLLKEAALSLRALLAEYGLDALLLLDGGHGAALWIPFSDAPQYAPVRAWLHEVATAAEQRHPKIFSTAHNSAGGDIIHLHVDSNAVGRWSALPYSLRGHARLPMCTPLPWPLLANYSNGDVTAHTFPQYLAQHSDVFAQEVARIGEQHFSTVASGKESFAVALPPQSPVPAPIIAAALQILADGQTRDSQAICDAARAQGLLPQTMTRKHVYTALSQYVERALGSGRKPLMIENPDRTFRLNHPVDSWPSCDVPPLHSPPSNAVDLIARLRSTAIGDDPSAFEVAVCHAFAAFGFITTHVGGEEAPDGYCDAPLGPLRYRVMLECKTGHPIVNNDADAFEAAKYRDAYRATYCTLIGSQFGDTLKLASELRTHNVSAWTVVDLVTLLQTGSDIHELRPLFAPGFASDALADLQWDRNHGARKRMLLIARYVHEEGWRAQCEAAQQGSANDAPLLTVDAAMLLVDRRLASENSHAAVSRSEIQQAMQLLTNPAQPYAIAPPEQAASIIITIPPKYGH
ncbi:MAG: hypothetical protein GIW98_02335 [Candidatus Eremiobacteraeota bacterium]|nr:hypothetical protein [Candidatus Eremiobacteraeota bacterium]